MTGLASLVWCSRSLATLEPRRRIVPDRPYEVAVLWHKWPETTRKFKMLESALAYAKTSAKAIGVRKVRLYRFDQNEPIKTWRSRPPWPQRKRSEP